MELDKLLLADEVCMYFMDQCFCYFIDSALMFSFEHNLFVRLLYVHTIYKLLLFLCVSTLAQQGLSGQYYSGQC